MTDDLLELALADPERAWDAAGVVVADSSEPGRLSVAHQARGIVLRDAGRAREAVTELRTALHYATQVDAVREADVRGTLGLALVMAGRTSEGRGQLDRAASAVTGEVHAKVLMRRAFALTLIGDHTAALEDMRAALVGIRRWGDATWEARTLTTLASIERALGMLADAVSSCESARRLFESTGNDDEALDAVAILGELALDRGDLPRALAILGELASAPGRVGYQRADIAVSRSEAYLAAGLATEAVQVLRELLAGERLSPMKEADILLALARARRAAGDPAGARAAASEARTAFRGQHRDWFALRAALVEAVSRNELGDRRGLARQVDEIARRLHEERAAETPAALILAGRLAAGAERIELWHAAAEYRQDPNPLVRASAWLASALVRETSGDHGGVLRGCGRGLAALDEHRRTLGSSELRAFATSHGRELSELALRHAAHDGRTLLRWSERWRATALAQPLLTSDVEVSPELAALRDNGRRLAQARADGEPTEQLEIERARLERAVRAEHHRRRGRSDEAGARFDVGRLVDEVGAGTLIELVDVDGTLHVLVVHDGRVRRRVAGRTVEAVELAERGRSALRRAARGRPYDPGDLGARLQEAMLGPGAAQLPDGPVVLVPTGLLHAAPWALLPTLGDRAFGIVPSAAQWLRARAVRPRTRGAVVLMAAPGLGGGGAEVPRLAARHPGAVLLEGADATVEKATAALDGARLAHLAAHGHFRPDSPLFSSLELADGPLSVYELERLKVAPYRLVLSACESGVLAPVGADELLGLASALFSTGTAGLVCSIAEVNDEATASLMLHLHAHLAEDPHGGPAAALLAARRHARGDPTSEATAAAFLALGV